MNISYTIPTALCSTLLAASAPAMQTNGEHTVTPSPFSVTHTIDATLLPENPTLYRLSPDSWTKFPVASVPAQGTLVKKADPLITFDTLQLDRQIEALEKNKLERAITLAESERALAELEISTKRKLERAEREFSEAKADFQYYKESTLPFSIENQNQLLVRNKLSLEYAEEELKQLLKMYEEDGITEDTEEIILKRQRIAVDSAQMSYKQFLITNKHTLEVTIPRLTKKQEEDFKTAELDYKSTITALPRALELKRMATAKEKLENERADEKLAQLKADRAQLNITAPADGILYYGAIKNGKWNADAASKFLKPKGSVPADQDFITFIPADAKHALYATATQSQRLQLSENATGIATLEGLGTAKIPVTLASSATYPTTTGTYPLTFEADLPEGLIPGMKAKIKLTSYTNDQALTIPASAMTEEADGTYSVRVKLADGKDEKRTVVPGLTSGKKVEIKEGLEAGQVILTKG